MDAESGKIILLVAIALAIIAVAPAWRWSKPYGYIPSGILTAILVIFVVFFFMGRARAQEYGTRAWIVECGRLYALRNDFFHERGLCFTRPGAQEIYRNNARTCTVDSAEDIPISERQKRVLAAIRAREIALGCPRP